MSYARISKTFTFHAGHRLQNHNGKCRRLHGHSYDVDIVVVGHVNEARENSGEGMVLDFDRLKEAWVVVDSLLDHKTILDTDDPLYGAIREVDPDSLVPFDGPPTAERLAQFIWDRLLPHLTISPTHALDRVRVWETKTSFAEAGV